MAIRIPWLAPPIGMGRTGATVPERGEVKDLATTPTLHGGA